MAQHAIPDNAGPFRIIESMAGTPIVLNDKTGRRKVSIPCKTWSQAEEVLRRLEQNDHNGVIQA